MTAMTQIQDLLEKEKQITDKAASLLYQAIQDRMNNGTVNANIEKDIINAVSGFPAEKQTVILTKALVYLAMNGKGSASMNLKEREKKPAKKQSRSGIFNNDGWF